MNTVLIVLLILLEGSAVAYTAYCIYKLGLAKGLQHMWNNLRLTMFHLMNTPPSEALKKKSDCKVLHETARLEKDLYDYIVSSSVFLHVRECKLHSEIFSYSKFKTPTVSELSDQLEYLNKANAVLEKILYHKQLHPNIPSPPPVMARVLPDPVIRKSYH